MSILIIVNGESNSGGYAPNAQAPAQELGNRESIRILNNTTLKFETLNIGVNNLLGHDRLTDYSSTHHGIELGLANAADSGVFGKEQIFLVKTGQGGSVIEDWVPGSNYYQTMLLRVQATKALLPNTVVKPILWYFQGINNAKGDNNLPQYRSAAIAAWKAKTLAYHSQLRAALGFASLPILFSEITPQFPYWNAAITEIARSEPNCVPISASGCSRGDDYHWDYSGMKLLSSRFAAQTASNFPPESPPTSQQYFVIDQGYYAGARLIEPSLAQLKPSVYTNSPLPSTAKINSGNCPKFTKGRWVNDASPAAVTASAKRHIPGSQQYSSCSNSIIVCDGNSITASVSSGSTWAAQLKLRPLFSDVGCELYNLAVGGQTTQQMALDATAQIDSLYDSTKDCVLIAWEIGNDLYFGASVQAACQNFADYCAARKKVGWKVVAITVADRLHPSGTPAGDTQVEFTAKILLANAWLRANWRNFSDALIDSRRVGVLSDASNTAYFPDNIHPNGAALSGLVDLLVPELIRLIEYNSHN